ncbi:MAG: ribosome biogenesis GTPase Der [Gammaproteobacteria bacterium]|nr:ribosome biogenesis GTPase Der [Gammaproteobacteria bacterium]MDH5776686.1 ribosome biogenesis GTPase Der [Gammaproteobacteria bacterium]
MKPVIALVGRPNVGKSTLFNRLTKTRDALVADQPGLTRDRKFGEGKLGGKPYIVIDTGGLSGDDEGVDAIMATQSWLAVEQADIVMFLTDAKTGLTGVDEEIAHRLRTSGKTIHIVVNKIDGLNADVVMADFHSLGLGEPIGISAVHGRGVSALITDVLELLPEADEEQDSVEQHKGIRIAVVGRPNVGKSTLVNRILGEERVVTYDLPGTTRDSIYLPFERDEQDYVLIDTAGVRRRRKINEAIEKFSVIKTLQAIEDAHVVILMLDASEGITDQDASLLGFVLDTGRALVLAVNKWDGLETDQRDKIKRELDVKLPFVDFAKIHFISALHGSGVGDLFGSINVAYKSAMAKFQTPRLTRLLEDFVSANPPPMSKGRRIKLRYAHQGGQNPPIVVIHGNQVDAVPAIYKRYLMNAFRKHLKLKGTPLRIEFKAGKNPYEGRKNKLTTRQQQKRKRLMKHVKSKK